MLNRYARTSNLWRRAKRLITVRKTFTGIFQGIRVHDASRGQVAFRLLQTGVHAHATRIRLAFRLLHRIRQLLRLRPSRYRK